MARQSSAYNMYEAKTRLSELVEKARRGEKVVLMNRGDPVALIVPLPQAPPTRKLGFLKGQGRLLPGWDEPIKDFKNYE